MTSHDRAFFTADGDDLVPSPLARGPWGSTISGTYVGGLLGRAIEHSGGDDDLQPARLTVDLLRPVSLLEPVRVATTVEREGRRIRLVDATMTQNVVMYTVEINTENNDKLLLPYLTANVRFVVRHESNALLVPNAALRWSPSSPAF